MSIEPDTANEAESFLRESGILRSIMLDSALVSLRHHLNRDGNVGVVHRHDGGTLRVKALLNRRWRWADTEGLERRIVSLVLATNPYIRIAGVEVRKLGDYFQMKLGVD